jgi:pimeloyl-ACP methyl ester carboxylesterase
MPKFDSGGVSLHYEDFGGEGYPLVLLHGFVANTKLNWVATKWIDELTPLRHVYALDARGHGESDKPHDPEAYAGDTPANDVIALLDHLGLQRVDVFGYSMGGHTSLRLLAAHRDRLRTVVIGGVGDIVWERLHDATNAAHDEAAKAMLAEEPSAFSDELARGFRALADMVGSDRHAMAAYLRSRRLSTTASDFAGVTTPVLFVSGEQDTRGIPDKLAKAVAGSRVVLIPDRDHMTVVGDQRFKETVVRFLCEHA